MLPLKQEAIKTIESVPEEKLVTLIQFMQAENAEQFVYKERHPKKMLLRNYSNFANRCPTSTTRKNWRNIGRRDSVMRILIDMNVILDYILKRNKFFEYAKKIVEFCNTDVVKILLALNDKDFSDFEDCLKMQCAKSFRADYIITRNVKDFAESEIPVITPEDFFKTEE